MNKTYFLIALLVGALVLSPTAAFADHSADDSGSEATESVDAAHDSDSDTIEYVEDSSTSGRRDDLRRKAELIERAQKERRDVQERFRMGSTAPARLGSTTVKERFQNSGKGVDPAKIQVKGAEKIDERIARMKAQIARVNDMERLSDEQKAAITADLTAQIAALTELKGKIANETSTTTLKELTQSITKSYRVYAVTMPKAAITAAADRIMTVVGQMESFSTKLSARIDAAKAAGTDVAAAETAYADFTAKVADAKLQAQAAANLVAGLQADNGDTAVQASNAETLKSAKAKIDAAQADLKAARADIGTILKAVKGASATTGS